jgi:hypothetical protein
MIRYFMIFLLTVLCASSAQAAAEYGAGKFVFQRQSNVSCMRPEIWGVLNRLAARIGTLEITAGCNGRHVANSFHYKGMAVDFLPMRASQAAAMAALRDDPAVGGLIAEGRGLVHVDTGRRGPAFSRYVAWWTGAPKAHTRATRHFAWGQGRQLRRYAHRAGPVRFRAM